MHVTVNKHASMGKAKRTPLPLSGELRSLNIELVERHYYKKPDPPSYTILVVSDAPDLVVPVICKRVQNVEARVVMAKTFAKDPMAIRDMGIQPDCVFLDHAIGVVKPIHKQKVFNAVFRILKYRGLLVTMQRESFKENNTGFVPTFMQEASSPYPATPYPSNPTALRGFLYNAGFEPIYETARWLQYSAYACVKGSSKGIAHAR